MFLIQLLLPLYDNAGTPIDGACYAQTRTELIERFGGLTAYSRAPADGLWKPDGGAAVRDELVVVEIMADVLDEAWWKDYRHRLEVRFRQQSILVRALHATLL